MVWKKGECVSGKVKGHKHQKETKVANFFSLRDNLLESAPLKLSYRSDTKKKFVFGTEIRIWY